MYCVETDLLRETRFILNKQEVHCVEKTVSVVWKQGVILLRYFWWVPQGQGPPSLFQDMMLVT